MWKNTVQAGATDYNMPHVNLMLDTYGYQHPLRMRNNYCFSTTTMVARTCLYVTLYVYSLSFFFKFISSQIEGHFK